MSSMRTSRSRRRLETVPARIRDRDLWIFEALGKMRFLTTAQLARLFFGGSRWCANKRLRRLYDAGLVVVWVRSLAEENLYSLSRKGRETLRCEAEVQQPRIYCPGGLDKQLTHLLAINDVRVGMIAALSDNVGHLIEWHSDWDLRQHAGALIVPDSIFTIQWTDASTATRTYSLEIDHHTKSTTRFLNKIVGYAAVRHQPTGLFGFRDYTMLIVVCDQRWLANYRTRLAHVQLTLPIYFASAADLTAHGPLGVVWTGIYNPVPASLRTISNLPNCKETPGAKTDETAGGYSSPQSSYREARLEGKRRHMPQ